jgi:divalent metal cation (Fe/Co/Zn/Cd) transporter
MASTSLARANAARRGLIFEATSVVWMLAEAALAIGAGIVARSVLLTAFGFDSVIELLSASVLIWRMSSEARGAATESVERAEHRAIKLSAGLLVVLCLYVVTTAAAGLISHVEPAASWVGLIVAGAAVIVMPGLALGKRAANRVLESSALRADIAETTVCAYMAGTVLVGVLLNRVFGWWWAEYIAAAGLLYWLALETREALEAIRETQPSTRRDDE